MDTTDPKTLLELADQLNKLLLPWEKGGSDYASSWWVRRRALHPNDVVVSLMHYEHHGEWGMSMKVNDDYVNQNVKQPNTKLAEAQVWADNWLKLEGWNPA
jgi:hypothetical protein